MSPDHPTLEWILERLSAAIVRRGVKICIIDPWNELAHERGDMSMTDYIGYALRILKRFARKHSVLVIVVAHPMKMRRAENGRFPMPCLYDIADSAHWKNRCDVGVIVHRDTDEITLVRVEKVRYHDEIGRPGDIRAGMDGEHPEHPRRRPAELAVGPGEDRPHVHGRVVGAQRVQRAPRIAQLGGELAEGEARACGRAGGRDDKRQREPRALTGELAGRGAFIAEPPRIQPLRERIELGRHRRLHDQSLAGIDHLPEGWALFDQPGVQVLHRPRLTAVDTGSDTYAVIVSSGDITDADAQKVWDEAMTEIG